MEFFLTMPKPGETIREGRVVQWLKAVGASLEEQEPLVELETEKAVFTFESPFRGVLKEILGPEGDQVSEEDGERYKLLGVGLPAGAEVPGDASSQARSKTAGPKAAVPSGAVSS